MIKNNFKMPYETLNWIKHRINESGGCMCDRLLNLGQALEERRLEGECEAHLLCPQGPKKYSKDPE